MSFSNTPYHEANIEKMMPFSCTSQSNDQAVPHRIKFSNNRREEENVDEEEEEYDHEFVDNNDDNNNDDLDSKLTWSTPSIETSTVQAFVGNKYKQELTHYSTYNVVPCRDTLHKNQGYRMEDYGLVHCFNDSCTLLVVCDGHGSVSYAPGRFIGGYECARFAAHYLLRKMKKEFKKNQLSVDIPSFLSSLFDNLQRRLCKHIVSKTQESKIDGFHFQSLDIIDTEPCIIDKTVKWEQDVLYPLHVYDCENQSDVFQDDNDNNHSTREPYEIIDYGTTCTCVLILDDDLYIAQVGDSDVYLYNGTESNVIKLTCDHSVNNANEIKRISNATNSNILNISKHYFEFLTPLHPYTNLTITRKIMPSRSLGHSFLSQYGITHVPTVIHVKLKPHDVIITGTDGLWNLPNIHFYIMDALRECANINDASRRISRLVLDKFIRPASSSSPLNKKQNRKPITISRIDNMQEYQVHYTPCNEKLLVDNGLFVLAQIK
jgi:serine/threonine protein phosphatase PrpC